jgi:uncharacterized protein
MKIAIISDIHDHLDKLRITLERIRTAEATVCCGDLCSPFIVREIGQQLQHPVHIVFGNNDGDLFRLTSLSAQFPHVQLHGEFAELHLGGKAFAVNHFDNIARTVAKNGSFDVVCFGHNHQPEITRLGKTLLINPGEICGVLTGKSTFAVYDSETHEAQIIDCLMRPAQM